MDAAALAQLVKEYKKPQGPTPKWKQKLQDLVQGEIRFGEALKRHTTLQVGGPADALVFPKDHNDLQNILKFLQEHRVPWTVLGRGSNVLVRDGGIRGLVLCLNKVLTQLEILEENEEQALIQADAGVPLPKMVELGRQKGFANIACLYGIPASVGGALWMNAGNREGEIKDFVSELRVMLSDGSTVTYPFKRLKFEYRRLRLPQKGILLSAKFCFPKANLEEVQTQLKTYQEKRHTTQPLDLPNLGSVFKNPEKGFAAQLIEELNLKGIRVGGARISEKHANFIVNENNATAKDVLALIGLVKDKVQDEVGIRLELEAKVLGDDLLPSGESAVGG